MTLVVLVVVNLVLGIVAAWLAGTFRLSAVADFLKTRVIPFGVGYAAVCAVAVVNNDFNVAVPVVWGFIVAALLGTILGDLKSLGLPVPELLAGTKEDAELEAFVEESDKTETAPASSG